MHSITINKISCSNFEQFKIKLQSDAEQFKFYNNQN